MSNEQGWVLGLSIFVLMPGAFFSGLLTPALLEEFCDRLPSILNQEYSLLYKGCALVFNLLMSIGPPIGMTGLFIVTIVGLKKIRQRFFIRILLSLIIFVGICSAFFWARGFLMVALLYLMALIGHGLIFSTLWFISNGIIGVRDPLIAAHLVSIILIVFVGIPLVFGFVYLYKLILNGASGSKSV